MKSLIELFFMKNETGNKWASRMILLKVITSLFITLVLIAIITYMAIQGKHKNT